jgi:hypothetical protein|tara:strand:- start:308 stop:562 length:255 start_codon:yes stop_codon:yes gene_type:complete
MTLQDAWVMIVDALDEAEAKYPDWPDDQIHAAAIMSEESGETIQAAWARLVIDHVYRGRDINNIAKEAVQTGAMALRILINLPE